VSLSHARKTLADVERALHGIRAGEPATRDESRRLRAKDLADALAGLTRVLAECLEDAYQRGYADGRREAREAGPE
jgi:flagellar biosynthesis/type III secretory pathway protein FliH